MRFASPWGWKPERTPGIWRHGARWLRPFAAAAPWLSVLVLLMQFHFVGQTMTASKGLLFDLPDGGLRDGEATDQVALAIPFAHETLVIFDDARYLIGDGAAAGALERHFADRCSRVERKTLLLLADRRIPGGDLMKLADLARRGGFRRVLFAEKTSEGGE